jgi:hypothetical protein
MIVGKSQLMILSQRRLASDSIEERKQIEETEKQLQSKIIRMENQMPRSTFDVGEIFLLALQTSILKLTDNKNISYSIAMFQADAVMAADMINKSCDILLTSDSDQAAILGQSCICIKNFKISEEKKKTIINNIEISFADEATYEKTKDILTLPSDSSQLEKAKFPVFNCISCPRVRALVAVALGCDVNLQAATTPAKMMSFIVSKDISNILSTDAYLLIRR